MPEISESAQANEQVSALPGLGFILFACFLLAGKRAYTQIWRKNSMSAKDAQQFREARQRALQELAELDEKYESGQLGNPGYMFARKRRKQQLVELTVLCENYCNVQHPTSNVEH
ncbi:MAG: hypothetical protein GY801_50270 [bacterium]|nr:hypothetical protein [bacterium]